MPNNSDQFLKCKKYFKMSTSCFQTFWVTLDRQKKNLKSKFKKDCKKQNQLFFELNEIQMQISRKKKQLEFQQKKT